MAEPGLRMECRRRFRGRGAGRGFMPEGGESAPWFLVEVMVHRRSLRAGDWGEMGEAAGACWR